MPKKKQPELTKEEQKRLFEKAAKDVGVTESEEEFEHVFKKVVRSKMVPKVKR